MIPSKISNVLILDTETTGVDENVDKAIEVAAIQFNIEFAAPIEAYSSLIYHNKNDAEFVNGISLGMLELAPKADVVWNRVEEMAMNCDVIVAHNAEFDMKYVPKVLLKAPWVCSMSDFKYLNHFSSKSLVAIALAHGVGVVHAHRAMSDVETLSRLFTRLHEMGANLEDIIKRGLRPKSRYQALVSYQDRDKAKNEGFSWDADCKKWWRKMADEDVKDLPFQAVKWVQ